LDRLDKEGNKIYNQKILPWLAQDIIELMLKKHPLNPTRLRKEITRIRHENVDLSTICNALGFLSSEKIQILRGEKRGRETWYDFPELGLIKAFLVVDLTREVRPNPIPLNIFEYRWDLPSNLREWTRESWHLIKTSKSSNRQNEELLRYTGLPDAHDQGFAIKALKSQISLSEHIPHETSIQAIEMLRDNEADFTNVPIETLKEALKNDSKVTKELCLLGAHGQQSVLYYLERKAVKENIVFHREKTAYREEFARRIAVKKKLQTDEVKDEAKLIKGFIDGDYHKIVTTAGSKAIIDILSAIPDKAERHEIKVGEMVVDTLPQVYVIRGSLVENQRHLVRRLAKTLQTMDRFMSKRSWLFQRSIEYVVERMPIISICEGLKI